MAGNFGRGLAVGVKSASEALESARRFRAEQRAEEEYQLKKEYEAKLKEVGAPATLENRQGYTVKGPDGQSFQVPTVEARDAYTSSGYTSSGEAAPYQEVNVGSKTLGQHTGLQGPANAAKQQDAYGSQVNQRMSSIASQYNKPLEAAAYLGLDLTKYQLKDVARQESIKQKKMDINRMYDGDPLGQLVRRYGENKSIFGQGEHAGQTATGEILPNGGVEVSFFDKKGNAKGKQTFSAEQFQKASMRQRLQELVYTDPTDTKSMMALADLGLREKDLDARIDFQGKTLANQALGLKAQLAANMASLAHYGTVAQANADKLVELRKASKLAETMHGTDSPEYKLADDKAKTATQISKNLNELGGMIDKNVHPNVFAKKSLHASQFATAKGSMPFTTKTDAAGNVVRVTTNTYKERAIEYAQQWVGKENAQLRQKYDPRDGVRAVHKPDGTVGYLSNKTPTPAGALGPTPYATEAELVKSDGLTSKATKIKSNRSASKAAEAKVTFPFSPSGTGLMPPSSRQPSETPQLPGLIGPSRRRDEP